MSVIQADLQGQKINLKVKFLKNIILNKYKQQISVRHYFLYMILNGKSIYGIILVIQEHFQDEKVNSKFKI